MKRLNYFHHQFLEERDFQDEQTYQIEMRRRHNRTLHFWGVAEGLAVTRRGDREIVVSPGMAIDKEGREIILPEETVHDLSGFAHMAHAWITLAYHEEHDPQDRHSAGGIEGYTRTTETCELAAARQQPSDDGSVITLARVQLNANGHVGEIDSSVRVHAGSLLRDGSVTRHKLAPELRDSLGAGWLRMPFKPVKLDRLRLGGRLQTGGEGEEGQFIVDVDYAYCGQRGARGTMGIPVPPGARKIKGFRIAGKTNGKVTTQLFRTGWINNQPERTELLLEIAEGPSFHKHVRLDENLDPEGGALAISVVADGPSEIWLVATEFQ